MKISAYTVCFVSTKGENNLWRPLEAPYGTSLIMEDVKNPKLKSWRCKNPRLRALEITIGYIKDLYGDPEKQTIVWIYEKDLKED